MKRDAPGRGLIPEPTAADALRGMEHDYRSCLARHAHGKRPAGAGPLLCGGAHRVQPLPWCRGFLVSIKAVDLQDRLLRYLGAARRAWEARLGCLAPTSIIGTRMDGPAADGLEDEHAVLGPYDATTS